MRGKVVQSNVKRFQQATPVVFLQGSTTPFTTKTLADPSGQFSFKKLLRGTYTLIVAVPRAGEQKQTVVVSASLADSKGRVEVTVVFEPKPSQEDAHEISTTQLAIPDGAQREYEKALARLEKRDVTGAVEHLRKAVEIAPRFSVAWNHLGTIAYQTKKFEEAEKYFREALRHDPDSYPPLVNLGGALISQGKTADSVEINLKAVKVRPDDALAHSQLGQSYFFLGRFEEGEKHLKQAKALDPKHFSMPQLILAEIFNRKGNVSAAIEELEEFLRFHPDSDFAPKVKQAVASARSRLKESSAAKPR